MRPALYGPGSKPGETKAQIIARVTAQTRETLRGATFMTTDVAVPARPEPFLPSCCELDPW